METPAEPATHANHGIDWEYVDAHHHPVTLVRRPVYEGWVLTLFGLILVGLIGLLGWTGYALSTVKAELRQVQAHVRQLQASVAQLEPRSPADRNERRQSREPQGIHELWPKRHHPNRSVSRSLPALRKRRHSGTPTAPRITKPSLRRSASVLASVSPWASPSVWIRTRSSNCGRWLRRRASGPRHSCGCGCLNARATPSPIGGHTRRGIANQTVR
jgi:hypothetical protein